MTIIKTIPDPKWAHQKKAEAARLRDSWLMRIAAEMFRACELEEEAEVCEILADEYAG